MSKPFYILDTIHASDIRLFSGGQVVTGYETRCPECYSIFPLRVEGRISIGLNHLGRQGFVEYLWNSNLLPIFRNDLIKIWLDSGITGFQPKPVDIISWYKNKKRPLPENIPSYNCLVPTTFTELIEPLPVTKKCLRCGFVKYNFPAVGSHLPDGIHLDLSTWSGADIFGLIGYGYIFCSERVLDVTLPMLYKHIAFWNGSKIVDTINVLKIAQIQRG
jgi:hypothetical protein